MTRAIKFKSMVGKDADRFPSINLVFKGEEQAVYFQVREMAESADMSQTAFARRVLADYAKRNYKGKPKKTEKQLKLKLENPVWRDGKTGKKVKIKREEKGAEAPKV